MESALHPSSPSEASPNGECCPTRTLQLTTPSVAALLRDFAADAPVVSNCLGNQILTSVRAGCHGAPSRAIALRMVSSFRMHAVSATFVGLPASRSR